MSGGQAEAARAARIKLEQTGAADQLRETAKEGEAHDGGDLVKAAEAHGSSLPAYREHGWVM